MPATHSSTVFALPRGLWKARANTTSRPATSAGKKIHERKDGTVNSSDTTDDERHSHSSSTSKPRHKYSPSYATLSGSVAAEDHPHHFLEEDRLFRDHHEDNSDSFYNYSISRQSTPSPSHHPPTRASKWITRSRLMDTSGTVAPGTRIDREACDYDDWEDLKELFAKAAEQYENDETAEALPLLRGVVHECHRFLVSYDDPSILFTKPHNATGIGPSISGGLPIRPKKDWATSSIAAQTQPLDIKSKYGELPTAFHAIFGTALFLFGNLIAQDPSRALEGEPTDPMLYWFAALDVFETGENLPSRTNGHHVGLPEDWRMAIVWGRTLVCIADEIVTRTRKAKEVATTVGSGTAGATPDITGAGAVPPLGMSGLPGSPGFPGMAAFNPYASTSTSPYMPMSPFQSPIPYDVPVMNPMGILAHPSPIPPYGAYPPSSGPMFPGSNIPYLIDEPNWPPESPFSAIASRRPPRTRRTALARQSPNQLMKNAVDQFTRGIFFMPHSRRQVQLPSMAGGGISSSHTTGFHSPCTTSTGNTNTTTTTMGSGARCTGIGLSQTNTGAIPVSSTKPPFLPPFTGGASSSASTSRAAPAGPPVQELFSRAKELFTIASEVLLLAEKVEVPSDRKTWAAWADSVFNQMKMEADMDAWRGPITRARGRCWLIIGSAPLEVIEPALENGEMEILQSDQAKDARKGLSMAVEFFEIAKGSASVVGSETKEEHAMVLEELRPLLVEALLTLGNLEMDKEKRQEYYDRAKVEAGDMEVDLMDDEEDGDSDEDDEDEGSKSSNEGSSMEVV